MSPKFQVGDMVRCVFGDASSDLKTGRVYTVCGVEPDGWPCLAENHGYRGFGWWDPLRFELVPDDDSVFARRSRSKRDRPWREGVEDFLPPRCSPGAECPISGPFCPVCLGKDSIHTVTQSCVFDAVVRERVRQDAMFGPQGNMGNMTPAERIMVLMEEVGELAQALNAMDRAHAKEELVRVAAVAVAWLEVLEARGVDA